MATFLVLVILVCLVGLSINKMRKTNCCTGCSKHCSCSSHHSEPNSHNLCGH